MSASKLGWILLQVTKCSHGALKGQTLLPERQKRELSLSLKSVMEKSYS